MDLPEDQVSVIEGDEMASYGPHPELHEHLVRSANPALYEFAGRPGESLAAAHREVRQLMGEFGRPNAADDGLTLSA